MSVNVYLIILVSAAEVTFQQSDKRTIWMFGVKEQASSHVMS